jgi:predicted RNA polymerase sigma factor
VRRVLAESNRAAAEVVLDPAVLSMVQEKMNFFVAATQGEDFDDDVPVLALPDPANLPDERDRALILGTFWGGIGQDRLAEALDVDVRTIRRRLAAAIENLRAAKAVAPPHRPDLRRLPEEDRVAMVLRWSGFTNAAIARALKVSLAQARRRLAAAQAAIDDGAAY